MKKTKINNTPDSNTMWKGLAGHFESLSQILNEFIDNCISNLRKYNPIKKNIIVSIIELDEENISITIEDSGSGFQNIDAAFTLGGQDAQESPLNEHGYGFKHAIATACPDNRNWSIFTRTNAQYEQGSFTKIKAQYKLENFFSEEKTVKEESWPGQIDGSGSFIIFQCKRDLFNTIKKGLRGNYSTFEGIVDILIEDIGFTYANLISAGSANISVVYKGLNGEQRNRDVKAIEPDIEKWIVPGKGKASVRLDGSNVDVEYEFGAMRETDHHKYYKRNMSTSGVEIRINGRVLEYNLFKEIWQLEKHNCYNYLLVRLNIISDDPKKLPKTKTSKNGIRQGDKKLVDLFQWVRGYLPEPKKSMKDVDHETDLFEKLADIKRKQLPEPKAIYTEQKVYKTIGSPVRIDLWVKVGDNLVIYEGKKLNTTVQDVHQLRMYWDGCIIDGVNPNKGILIASNHPESVVHMINHINGLKAGNGVNYNFELKTWNDEGIDYPSVA
jgi:hypothetical protein